MAPRRRRRAAGDDDKEAENAEEDLAISLGVLGVRGGFFARYFFAGSGFFSAFSGEMMTSSTRP